MPCRPPYALNQTCPITGPFSFRSSASWDTKWPWAKSSGLIAGVLSRSTTLGWITVNNDDTESGRLSVRHLVEQSYQKIAMLSLDTRNGSVIDHREAGYLEAMKAAGLGKHAQVIRVPQNLREIQVATQRLLERPGKHDAIFCWTDYVALEVLSVAGTSDVSVPEELAVVGHDNTMYCAFDQNSLTSIDQSGEQLGLQSTRLLVERIEGRQKTEHFLVHPRLVARRSTSRPSAKTK